MHVSKRTSILKLRLTSAPPRHANACRPLNHLAVHVVPHIEYGGTRINR